jgi:hypothetical protein
MQPETMLDLDSAIDGLSRPFESPNDVKSVSMKLDVIAAALLRNRAVAARLGEQRASELASSGAELPAVLRASGEELTKLAVSVEDLLAFSRSSLVDFGAAEQEVSEANAARQQVHDALASAARSLNG